ncbi:MAG: alkaline phosphatase [Pyrinomonadaceae bacterium]|nr:alkaline phosphatase [Pyrinomonadaceae bacterium]MBP6211992.1 alkaline phosphatase [Pyrinomonadaceae bacterium]
MNLLIRRLLCVFALGGLVTVSMAQVPQDSFPVKRAESAEQWRRDGWNALESAKSVKQRKGKAKNVILFIGDGMGVSTLTAARIFEGQMRGESGEENRLSFEEFPFSALSKTYSANQQTSDSAPTMSAIISGVKTDEGIISVDQRVQFNNYKTVKGNETKTLLEYAEESGRSTGVVSTARLTHATPAACYAHTASRDWESDADIFTRSKDAYEAKFPDIARQMIEFPYGDGLEVALGGGRSKFIPKEVVDPEYSDKKGERLDSRDLTREWTSKYKDSAFVWNKSQFDAIDAKRTKHLFGLFEPSHMKYEHDRLKNPAEEPSLADMTSKAIDILSNNKKGYFLMVEGGRIDHAHHDGNAYRALKDTVALSDAVRKAVSKVNLDDTLIVVTADHSHTFFIQGYPARGNNILGLVKEIGSNGELEDSFKTDRDKKTYSTLGYANGLGARGATRPVLSQEMVTDPDYKQEANIPMTSETHAGEDVAIFAMGVNAHLIRGSMEENWIFYVMADALRLGRK